MDTSSPPSEIGEGVAGRVAESPSEAKTGWGDLLAEGRLPRFALICLGIWIGAADTLVTATVMPSVSIELGGYVYFSWAVTGFLVGAILAGASAGRLSEIFGLRLAATISGLTLALGCVMSAAAPSIGVFVGGRIVQGIGSGWISGFSMVAIALLFPERHLARVFASSAAIWGIATVLGPLLGGVFAQAGAWRAVFWMFAIQALIFAAAAPRLLKGVPRRQGHTGVPWRQLAALALGVSAIALADVSRVPLAALAFIVLGAVAIALVFRMDARARVRLLPHRAGDLRTIAGAGYAAMFTLTAARMAFIVYGPAVLQALQGLTPLWAGYVVATEALAWTLAAFVVAGVTSGGERRWIRLGAGCILAGASLLALVMHGDILGWVIVAAVVMGMGSGFSSSLMNRRVLGVLADEDRAIGSSALIAVRQTGGAVGAAIAGATANLAGFGAGLTVTSARATAVWVFVTALPLALAGMWAAWRHAGSALES